jgi:hypothetical protein
MDYRYPGDTPEEYKEVFTYPSLARFLFTFGSRLTEEQLHHLESGLTGRARDLLEHGTENHAIMRIASGYLFAQFFPQATWHRRGGQPISSAEMMSEAKALLIKRGRGFYESGDTEMLSPTYAILNVIPLLNLWDFAADPEVKAIAEAQILYHVAQLALNNFEGHILPPYIRQPAPQRQYGPEANAKHRLPAVGQHVNWLFWNQNQVIKEDFTKSAEPAYAVMFALSNWRPPDVINQIAQGEGVPYSIRSRIPYISTLWGEWGAERQEYLHRSIWRDKLFAVCGGFQRTKPAGYFLDNALFRIVWHSPDRLNYLECSQPYWRSNQGGEEWSHGVTTPFQQMVTHRNSAIVLFDIPKADPWPGVGESRFTELRSRHTENLLQVGQCRFPKSVDELIEDPPWIFLREGDVYIGVRMLKPDYVLRSDLGGDMADFHCIKSYHGRTGFVFEAGSQQTSGTFDDFRKRLKAQPLQIDWDSLDVTYTNSHSDTLRLKYRPLGELDPDGFVDTVPHIWINGQEQSTDQWPLVDSPLVKLGDRTLRIGLETPSIKVDWKSQIPVFTNSRQ